MESAIYLTPIEIPDYTHDGKLEYRRFGDFLDVHTEGHFPDLQGKDLAIIGVKEARNSFDNHGADQAPDAIRKYLYALYTFNQKIKVADLGNVLAGHSPDDTIHALKSIISDLLANRIIPIVLGGTQDLTYANYLAYEEQGKIINITTVDSSFDLGNAEEVFNNKSFVSKIILHQPNYLFNLTNLGYQSYFVDIEAVRLMRKILFDVYRLGNVRASLEEAEPMVRNADIVSFDISSIRQSDAPGNANASPNGFYGEEACQIARYAGLSDKVSSIGFYELNPSLDNKGQTAHLVAQMVWYFMEGFYQRKGDYPHKEKDEYTKYIVPIDRYVDEIVFYKSNKSGRWWMEVPLLDPEYQKYKRHFMVPCSYQDYKTATQSDIPDRWWQVYQKIM